MRLRHVIDAIVLIQSFVKDQTLPQFLEDLKGQNAVLYQFLVIGEALRHIDNSVLAKYQYPWHVPKSFRNFIAHEYHKIRLEVVYRAANDLEPLKTTINTMLRTEFE